MIKRFELLCFLFLLSPLVSAQTPRAKQKPLVLTHVTVIDTTGGPTEPDMTIVIYGDRIAAVSKSGKIRVPPGSQVVNAQGKFLIPGLWDMNAFFYEKEYFPIFIANGVTGLRVMLGYGEHYEWRKEIAKGQLLGPRMVVASRWVEAPKEITTWGIPVANEPEARQAVINAQKYSADFIEVGGAETLQRDAFLALADEAKERGIPLEGHVPVSVSVEEASKAGQRSIDTLPQIFDVDVEILAACSNHEAALLKSWQEALAEFFTSGHSDDPLWKIPGSRVRLQLALDTYDQQKALLLFAFLRAHHTWVTPTLTAERNFAFFDDPSIVGDPRLKYVSVGERNWFEDERNRLSKARTPEDTAVMKKVYQKYFEIVGAMHRTGVELLAGTTTEEPLSTVPGFGLHDELALLVQAGLTPMEALQTATLNPARFLDREQDFGTVAPGKVADLVLLDANPLEDINNTRKIAAVVYSGKLFPRASLDAMLAKIEALASRKSIGDLLKPIIKEKGMEAAIRKYRELRSTQRDSYDFEDRAELRSLGDDLLSAKKFEEAIEIFELNVENLSHYWWAYDSLGDAYMEAGKKDLAIKNYKKSLELDPTQTYAAIKLKELTSQ